MTDRPEGVQENTPLAPKTSMRVGGAARFYAELPSNQALANALRWAQSESIPTAVIGGGTNLLCADAGFSGLVLHYTANALSATEQGSDILLRVDAGFAWERLVSYAVERRWAGVECLSGIPGNVGAVPIQNVGAYGRDVSEMIVSVDALERETQKLRTFQGSECDFGYRTSRFKYDDRDRFVITAVTLRLSQGPVATPRYPELVRRLEGKPLTPQTVREQVLSARREKSMVLSETDPNARSCGSFFLNPVITRSELDSLSQRLQSHKVPQFPTEDGKIKVPAAWLIERAGFNKGYRQGRAGLSEKHSLALVAHEGATCREVLALADTIQTEVARRFSVHLEREPVLLESP